jgi:hypothetical protein
MLTLHFNQPPEGDVDPATWPSFYVPAGELDSLLEDDRAFAVLVSGSPFRVVCEDETEGRYLLELVMALLEQRQAPAVH